MLWTDSLFVTAADLGRVDSECSKAVSDEGAVLVGNYGIIKDGLEEASQELNKIMVSFGGYLSSGDVSPNHISAVLNIGLGNSTRYKGLLGQVVVSGNDAYSWNHMKVWAVHYVLYILYRNLMNRTTKDRYEAKMRFYKSELDRRLTRSVTGLGIPMIIQPLTAPASLERTCATTDITNTTMLPSGTWDSTNLSVISSSGKAGGSFDVAITYVNQGVPAGDTFVPDSTKYVSYQKNGNAESNPSPTISAFAVPANFVLSVSIASLNPPNGAQDPATRIICVILPLAATGWNLYVGPAGGTLTLQNALPIPIGTLSYQLTGDPTTTGLPASIGQYSDRRLSISPSRQRA